jgi:exopolysaccharide biosynthesis polyprenyl glycosylphosphotransferase
VSSVHQVADSSLQTKIYKASRSVPRHIQWRLFKLSLVFSDVFMTALAFRMAYVIRFQTALPIFDPQGGPAIAYYQRIVIFLIPVWITIFAMGGLYDRKYLLGGTIEYSRAFNAITVGMFLVIAIGFLDPGFIIARGWLLLSWIIAFLLVGLGRFILRRMVYLLRHYGYFLTPAIIVGANDEGLSLARQLLSWKTSGLHILGVVDEKLPAGSHLFDRIYTLGSVNDLDDLIQRYQVEEIILASSAISSRDKMLEIFKCYGIDSGVNVRLSSGLYEIITTGLSVKEFAYVPLVGINQVRLTGIDLILKSLLDYIVTISVLFFIWPILLGIALAIKLSSPGPIIHRRRVMGVYGRQFDAFKFRTMLVNGDEVLEKYPELMEELAKNHKLKDDPRVTRIGNILRKFSLDELPQLLNVLRGEMSLVGPRMISPAEMEMYKKWGMNLLTVRPGITGLWQVSGRSDVSYDERVRLDMHYIRNWSIWFDLQILFQTIPAVLQKRGAY